MLAEQCSSKEDIDEKPCSEIDRQQMDIRSSGQKPRMNEDSYIETALEERSRCPLTAQSSTGVSREENEKPSSGQERGCRMGVGQREGPGHADPSRTAKSDLSQRWAARPFLENFAFHTVSRLPTLQTSPFRSDYLHPRAISTANFFCPVAVVGRRQPATPCRPTRFCSGA